MRNKTVKQKGGNYTELNKDMESILKWNEQNNDIFENDDLSCYTNSTFIKKLKDKLKLENKGVFHKQFGYSFRSIYSKHKLRDMIYNGIVEIIVCLTSVKNTNYKYISELQSLFNVIIKFNDKTLREKVNEKYESLENDIRQNYFPQNNTEVVNIEPRITPVNEKEEEEEKEVIVGSTQDGGIRKSRKSKKLRKSRKSKKSRKLRKSKKSRKSRK